MTRWLVALTFLGLPIGAQPTETLMLSGPDKDHTVPWEFRMSSGQNAGRWTTIAVPSNWELQKFGTYSYGRDVDPPDRGAYRRRFQVPAAWRGKAVRLVFEGVMTDATVRVNGASAGPTHRGGFYRFTYDVTPLLKYGEENVIEADVDEHSADESVNRAERQGDFWVFGGIYRPVYLEAMPARHIDRVAVDARADGTLRVDAYVGTSDSSRLDGARVTAQVLALDGRPLGGALAGTATGGVATLRGRVAGVRPWNPEEPNRYRLRVALAGGHTVTETIGFRTVEVRPEDGVYVNGTKVRLKGVNRHTFWPEAGRTTSRAISEMDVNLIKDMNMNAVRMSHYPPDPHFLDVADSLGLFVLDELTGWQRNYDTPVGETLVRELVVRDVNHPSIVLWDNGNEGGFNFDLDDDFAKWDPQGRKVMHPWTLHDGINTAHYRPLACCAGRVFQGRDLVMPTEVQHGLYDGGHGAGLADYWNAALADPRWAGMFLWDLVDQGVLRTDLPGDTLDTEGNRGADGIVGPHREKEASFYTIKKIWSPVHLDLGDVETLPPTFDGRFVAENRYDYTNLDRVRFAWQLVDFPAPSDRRTGHTVAVRGTAAAPSVAPGMRGVLALGLPAEWARHDALYLTATDPHGRELYTWTWMLRSPRAVAQRVVPNEARGPAVTATETADRIALAAGDVRVEIDRATGRLVRLARGSASLPLADGPRLVGGAEGKLTALTHRADGADHVVEATYDGALRSGRWRLRPDGWLGLDYRYELNGEVDAAGITFDLPDSAVTAMRWLGRGPYRVWKNRREGVEYDVWRKPYNDAVTGLVWQYPEFKGFHANLHWAVLETRPLALTVVTPEPDLFLRVLTPRLPNAEDRKMTPGATAVEFPPGGLSFLHAIPPIGNKFMTPAQISPSGRKNLVQRSSRGTEVPDYTASVWFYAGEPPAR
ncbi:glycoside hydrolase family 2 sugar binding protein (plasmid) [Gemmatirosa kalamazoonensis]|uniref:beta-galactosidase n=1 Tax=Gemmatirosa kalamazoonensis TaxID=861299 RepID=W0RRR6_9BACT|nr:glycoside hydrolase family 2 TIM barrel-domain containing protein [Gemmatirosa kalamazoonensis]AHG92263.1 glycoside hydrolase family 2 sugar binding protein [Gemmatirosa kalamazoonensis]